VGGRRKDEAGRKRKQGCNKDRNKETGEKY
jgi:hypothetical protein